MSGAAQVADALEREGVEVAARRCGDRELPLALPADEDAVVRTLERATADGLRVVPTGLSSKLAWCRPEVGAHGTDLLLSTAKLDAIVAYVPGDGTLTAQAGCRMADLARHVAEHGHRLTPDVPRAADATLGGTLGAGISGADRTSCGPVRHHVLGIRFALADGTVARSGGRLVKNVTGFDLHRLFTGSRGTLCVMLEASLRLFAEPECERAWSTSCAPPEGLAALERLTFTPRAATLRGSTDRSDWTLDLQANGGVRQIEAAAAEVRDVLESAAADGEVAELEAAEARTRRESLRDAVPAVVPAVGGSAPAFVATCLPSRVEAVLALLADAPGAPWTVVCEPLVASLELHGTDGLAPDAARELARQLATVDADLEPRNVSLDVHEALAPRATEHPELVWMRRLRATYDPQGVFASPLFPERSA